jgi:abequosyltransferase
MKKLSICIPTYNFGKFIGLTLDSILPQITLDVEVVILDGGSTDETAEIVAARQCDYKQLSYYHQDFRGGIDRDIEKVVSLAQGKYCWLFSADDIMLPGAVDKILEEIKLDMDIYICEHILCDLNMQPIREYPPFNNVTPQRVFNMSLTAEKKEYFCSARTSEAFFSFLAGPIFKKKTWNKANIPQTFRGTCWIVAGHLLSVIPSGVSIRYLGQVLLHKREGNDSFSNGSLVHRCKIGIENFQYIANAVFGENSEEATRIRLVLQRDVPLRLLLSAKLRTVDYPDTESIEVLQQVVSMHYADRTLGNLTKHVLFKLAHPLLLSGLRSLKVSLKRVIK